MFQHLLSCLGPYKKYAILTPLIIVVEVLIEVLLPWVTAQIINVGIGAGNISYVARMGGLMVLLSCISLGAGILAGYFSSIAGAGLSKGLRQQLFYKVQEFSFRNIDHFSTASLVTRLTTDVSNTQHAFMMLLRVAFRAPLMLIMATTMAIYLNRKLSLIFFAAAPILALALFIISKLAFPRFQIMLKQYDGLNARVQENLTAIHLIKALVREDYEKETFRDAADRLRNAQLRAEKVLLWNAPIMQLIMYACMIAISWFGGLSIIGGSMLPGDLLAYFSYVFQILFSLMMISMVFVMLVLSRASIDRICEVLDAPLDLTDAPNLTSDKPENGAVEFRNVSFSYHPEDPHSASVLQDINLSIRSGETVGILGGTGSAKSSLVQLIPRLYEATSGEVLVGGKNVKDYPLEVLHDAVGMVLQKNVLFSGTIKENLRWGNEHASDEELEQACRAAQAHDFITAFPDGYDTDLGQGGVNLSGGQKQRLCIARALLKNPQILILDDSTSAVDTATDANIRKALQTALQNTTTIIIAQRVSSIQDADKIIIMEDGHINAIGTHDSLLATNEIYREVYTSQQKAVNADGTW